MDLQTAYTEVSIGGLDSLLLINCGDVLTESILVLRSFFFFFNGFEQLYLLDAFHMIKHPSLGSRASIRSLKVTVYMQSHTVYYSRLPITLASREIQKSSSYLELEANKQTGVEGMQLSNKVYKDGH